MNWKKELKHNVETLKDLEKYIHIPEKLEKDIQSVIDSHPMSITRYYLSLIDKNNPDDPIKKMIVPSEHELDLHGTYDTSGESRSTVITGVQHKYRQTALILATNRCAAYCRFCFRKRLVGLANHEIINNFKKAVKYVNTHKEITNVLISGGDALLLPTYVIRKFLDELAGVKHLNFIRFGTRTPVVFPKRIIDDDRLVKTLSTYSEKHHQIYIVTHFNHPREITKESRKAISKLRNAGLVISNQSVLFKGVNDSPEILANLFSGLLRMGVIPYYLFQCRPVKGVKENFQVPFVRACSIVDDTRRLLDGHAKRFKYVMSHESGKIEIIGIMNGELYLKYHQARHRKNINRFFRHKVNREDGWMDDLKHHDSNGNGKHASFSNYIKTIKDRIHLPHHH